MFIPLSLLLVFATLSSRIFFSFQGYSCNETNIPILPSYNYQTFLRSVFFSAFFSAFYCDVDVIYLGFFLPSYSMQLLSSPC